MATYTTKTELNIEELGCRLGGTIKIAQLKATDKNWLPAIKDIFISSSHKNFSISIIGDQKSAKELAPTLKEELREAGHKARFVFAKGSSLSPLVIKKQKVLEFIIDPNTNQIFTTIWVHSFQNWIVRDRNKPFITPKSGMLPPKLARIMVNLALAGSDPQKTTLLDPFCGTGTVLMEALILGCNVIGSDLSTDKIKGAQKNLSWLPSEHFCHKTKSQPLLIHHDATHISQKLTSPINVIVTEPTLGPTSPKPKHIPNIIKGLKKLYLGALKDWQKFLKTGDRLVIAFPRFNIKDKTYLTHDFIDGRENLNYNVVSKNLVFTRPGAIIERQIVILTKK